MRQNSFTRRAQGILGLFEFVGLTVIKIATVIAGYIEVSHMTAAGTVALADLLLMFLYLEILAMVGMYFDSGKMPVRFPVYIAIVAQARYLVLALRYGHARFPYGEHE